MPLVRSPWHDLRIIWRAYSNPERRKYGRWFVAWLGGGAVVFSLSLLSWDRLVFGLLLRAWLFGGAAYALTQGAKFAPRPGEERVSTVGLLVIIAIMLGVGLVIGGSIMALAGED